MIAEVARDHPEAERLEVWLLDEARVGQTGRVCRRWFEKGMRPRGVRDLRHQAAYLFGAVCPARDAGVALSCPRSAPLPCRRCSTSSAKPWRRTLMPWSSWTAPAGISPRISPSRRNLTPLLLPPYAPELNAIERVWLYLRERFLSHRLWHSHDDILDACCDAWNALLNEAGRIRSLCTLDRATPVSS